MNQRLGVHPDVIKLGLVSFLTDVSSEMIFSVFAIFFTTIAGASSALLGVVEGLADFSASSLDYVAGWLSDKTGKRKIFALAGYGFSTLAKVILLIANSVVALGAFRVIERLGKSFRGPPRDAWLSTIADKGIRGYSLGVHKAFDKAGAIVGPLIAYALLSRLGSTASAFRVLFWVAFVPAALSVFVLSLIKDQPDVQRRRETIFSAWKTLSAGFKRYLAAAGIFSLAYFSFGFLLLRAKQAGFSVKDIVLLYALFNVSFVLAAPVIGKLGDRIGRTWIIALSYLVYLVMSLGFAFAAARWEIIVLFLLFGIFYSIDEAQTKAYIADIEPERRATAIGVYNFVTGVVYLFASLIAGALWVAHPRAVFLLAAILSLAAIGALAALQPARQ
ncbi:MAG: MFS transporter [Candidatus Acidiferrales bacterium]